MNMMRYIRLFYGVPAKRGGRVTVNGKPGVITGSDDDACIKVRFDTDPYPRRCHPTWRVEYHPDTNTRQEPTP